MGYKVVITTNTGDEITADDSVVERQGTAAYNQICNKRDILIKDSDDNAVFVPFVNVVKADVSVLDAPAPTPTPKHANWGQNDIYADDYIEGRTHWSEYSSVEGNIVPETTVQPWFASRYYMAWLLENLTESPITVGDTYKVTIDNTEYSVVCTTDDPNGDGYPSLNVVETGVNIFWNGYDTLCAAFNNDNEHTISVVGIITTETVHKLDSKYLPDEDEDEYVSVPAEIKFDNTNVSHTFTEGPNKVEMPITKITLVNPKTGRNLTLDSSTTALIYDDIFPTFYRVKYIPVINDPSMEKGPIYNDQWQYSKLCHSININPATSAASNPGLKGNYCFYVFFAPNYEEINPNQTRAQQLAGMALPIAANATLLVKRSLFD